MANVIFQHLVDRNKGACAVILWPPNGKVIETIAQKINQRARAWARVRFWREITIPSVAEWWHHQVAKQASIYSVGTEKTQSKLQNQEKLLLLQLLPLLMSHSNGREHVHVVIPMLSPQCSLFVAQNLKCNIMLGNISCQGSSTTIHSNAIRYFTFYSLHCSPGTLLVFNQCTLHI